MRNATECAANTYGSGRPDTIPGRFDVFCGTAVPVGAVEGTEASIRQPNKWYTCLSKLMSGRKVRPSNRPEGLVRNVGGLLHTEEMTTSHSRHPVPVSAQLGVCGRHGMLLTACGVLGEQCWPADRNDDVLEALALLDASRAVPTGPLAGLLTETTAGPGREVGANRVLAGQLVWLDNAPRWGDDLAATYTGVLKVREVKHHTDQTVTFLGHSPGGEWVIVEVPRRARVHRPCPHPRP